MRGWVSAVLGALLLVVGLVWTLQGLDVLGGSAMSGHSVWAFVGPVVAVAGLVLLVAGARAVRRRGSRAPG